MTGLLAQVAKNRFEIQILFFNTVRHIERIFCDNQMTQIFFLIFDFVIFSASGDKDFKKADTGVITKQLSFCINLHR